MAITQRFRLQFKNETLNYNQIPPGGNQNVTERSLLLISKHVQAPSVSRFECERDRHGLFHRLNIIAYRLIAYKFYCAQVAYISHSLFVKKLLTIKK